MGPTLLVISVVIQIQCVMLKKTYFAGKGLGFDEKMFGYKNYVDIADKSALDAYEAEWSESRKLYDDLVRRGEKIRRASHFTGSPPSYIKSVGERSKNVVGAVKKASTKMQTGSRKSHIRKLRYVHSSPNIVVRHRQDKQPQQNHETWAPTFISNELNTDFEREEDVDVQSKSIARASSANEEDPIEKSVARICPVDSPPNTNPNSNCNTNGNSGVSSRCNNQDMTDRVKEIVRSMREHTSEMMKSMRDLESDLLKTDCNIDESVAGSETQFGGGGGSSFANKYISSAVDTNTKPLSRAVQRHSDLLSEPANTMQNLNTAENADNLELKSSAERFNGLTATDVNSEISNVPTAVVDIVKPNTNVNLSGGNISHQNVVRMWRDQINTCKRMLDMAMEHKTGVDSAIIVPPIVREIGEVMPQRSQSHFSFVPSSTGMATEHAHATITSNLIPKRIQSHLAANTVQQREVSNKLAPPQAKISNHLFGSMDRDQYLNGANNAEPTFPRNVRIKAETIALTDNFNENSNENYVASTMAAASTDLSAPVISRNTLNSYQYGETFENNIGVPGGPSSRFVLGAEGRYRRANQKRLRRQLKKRLSERRLRRHPSSPVFDVYRKTRKERRSRQKGVNAK